MSHRRWNIIRAALAAAVLSLTGSAGALSAQEDPEGVARVVIRADLLHESIGGDGSGPTVAQWLKSLTIYADGRECGVLALLEDDGSHPETDVEFALGLPGQPAVCSMARARLSYADSEGRILFVKHYLEPGATYKITNFAPEPPIDPSPYPQVLIPARVLDTAAANTIGKLSVLAGGKTCGEISLTDKSMRNEDGDIVFFTHPYGGRVCGDPLTDELRFADPQGTLLAERFRFDFAKPMVLFDFALEAPPGPPEAGSGGLATQVAGDSWHTPGLVAAGLLTVAASLVLGQLRRE